MFLSGSDCRRPGPDRINDHMIILTPIGYLVKLSCILLLICIVSFPLRCVQCCHLPACRNQHMYIYLSRVMEGH